VNQINEREIIRRNVPYKPERMKLRRSSHTANFLFLYSLVNVCDKMIICTVTAIRLVECENSVVQNADRQHAI
jgi:hypothetical protein